MDSRPENTFIIRDLETLRIYADPIRVQIIEMLIDQPQTVREMAVKLGLSPSKLYYHINMLEKQGLILVTETRQVANLIEKQYAAAAPQIDIDPSLLVNGPAQENTGLGSMLQTTFDLTREDIIRSVQARQYELERGAQPKQREILLHRAQSYLTDEQATEYYQRLFALLDEYEAANQGLEAAQRDGLQLFTLMLTWYPNFYYPDENTATKPPNAA